MDSFIANQKVTLVNILPIDNNTQHHIIPISIVAKVFDGEGSQILSDISITLPNPIKETLDFVVDNVYNQLLPEKIKDVRKVRFYYTKSDGTVLFSDNKYIIEAEEQLITLVNSFMNYDMAELIADDLSDIEMWQSSDDKQKISTLKSAFNKIAGLRFRVKYDNAYSTYWNKDNTGGDLAYYIDDITLLSIEEFEKLPQKFIYALRAAQILQANGIMDGSIVEERRNEGIISETIGESKMFFNSRPVLKMPLCNSAMELLSKYLYKNVSIGRA